MSRFRIGCVFCAWLLTAVCTGMVPAQNPELQEKIAEVKQAAAANKQALAQYSWVEQVSVSLKGEQKKLEHFQVHLGPDGKPQKQSMDLPAQPPASSNAGGGRRGGRVKEHVVEKKKEEYADYADQIKSLIQQYVPPEKEKLEQAAQKGNIAAGPAGSAPGQYRLVINNYVKQGDNMTLLFDKARKALVSVAISSFLNDPKDAVNVTVEFASEPSGLSHVSSQTINGISKQLTIAIQNSQYRQM